ncbi:hypothetical protein SORBI_3003G001800 [Sorghum bicolor]|uniref:DUF1618 domain-containing protein n=1 Tax=Sorghum bicolor TaxID=4558 RepID=C5XJH8_SORBI|nr:hypothetical protein SORBI_3003G001800 [Sorghum bicolor]
MAPPPIWAILRTLLRVSDDADLPDGADISLALAAPPRLSHLTVSTRVSPADPDPHARIHSPHVLAADASGLLLAITPPPLSAQDPGEERVHRGPDGVQRTFTISYISKPDYAVLDLASATAHRLPAHDIFSAACLGVIAAPARDLMVVEFQSMLGGDRASLHCFSSHTGAWVTKPVRNPLPRWIWNFHDVVSHSGKLWWVDTAAGLLACDPFADTPDMAYAPLPRMIASRRVVQLSNDSFRCVHITPARHGTAPTVTMRTLANPETADWTLDYQVSFADIFADDTYKAAGLPDKEPVVALIHPTNPDVLYCLLDGHLFGVDVRARKVVECEAHGMAPDSVSSSSVLACKLPPRAQPQPQV